ncbi:hypothetical protein KP803_02495 [Vibrio sp. ZSDE26]|uniref:Outer membrane protein beta-barrel domain-containing protein n=1 Tax=Vibrio amylolyticus TaxID=2847292 RepID=A0A9X1XFZ8_9VIBR|nr:hypothetical protein [Vibrio amylolyticus]MCK6262141.1 hypothetical protein [Vibrio amylolyticus]
MRLLVLATTALLSAAVNATPFVNAQIGVGSDKANKISFGYAVDKHALSLGYMATESDSDKTYTQGTSPFSEHYEAEAQFAVLDYEYTLGSFDGFDMMINASFGLGNTDNKLIRTNMSSNEVISTDKSDHSATYYGLFFGVSRTFESVDDLSIYGLVGVDSYDYEEFDSGGFSGSVGLRYRF